MICPDCEGAKSPQAIRCMTCWTAMRLGGLKYRKTYDWEKLRKDLRDYAKDKGIRYYG